MEKQHVINLTKFKATAEMERFGVRDLSDWKQFQEIRDLLYFPTPPSPEIITSRVERLGEIALQEAKKTGAIDVLVACPPWMNATLCRELLYHGLKPVVSFTKKNLEQGHVLVSLVAAA